MKSISELFSQYLPTRTLGFPKRNSRQDKWGKCCQRGARGRPGQWVTFSVTIIYVDLYFRSFTMGKTLNHTFFFVIYIFNNFPSSLLSNIYTGWNSESYTFFVICIFNNFPSSFFSSIIYQWVKFWIIRYL